MPGSKPYTSTVYSRVGLMGNPSDSMEGAAVAVSIQNFSASVTIEPCDTVTIVPHPRHDATEFTSLEVLHAIAQRDGYYGGKRLLMVRAGPAPPPPHQCMEQLPSNTFPTGQPPLKASNCMSQQLVGLVMDRAWVQPLAHPMIKQHPHVRARTSSTG